MNKPIAFTLRFFSNFWWLLAFGIYALVFITPLPMQIESHGILITDEFLVFCAVVGIFFCYQASGWGWRTVSLWLMLVIFTLPMLRLWQNATSHFNLVLGLLPWSDASGYYSDALGLTRGELLGIFSGRRPIFAGFLATLLHFTNGNLQTALIFLAVVNATAFFWLASETRENFGPLAGAGLVLLAQYYYRQFAGSTLTEQLGIPLGALALSSLLHAVRLKNKWLFAVGLGTLTLALITRAGAFFVLPTTLICGAIAFREHARLSPKHISLFIAAILITWGVYTGFRQQVATPVSVSMGNFSMTLYGQAVGGKGWGQVFIDHPEIKGKPEAEQVRMTYQLALDEIYRNPLGLAQGSLGAWKEYFLPSDIAGFGFIQTGEPYSTWGLQFGCTMLLFIGAFSAWKQKASKSYALLIAIAIGIFLSIPFIPPHESAWMRIYAATIALPLILASIGLSTIVHRWRPMPLPSKAWIPSQGKFIVGLSTTLIIIALGGPLALKTFITPEKIPAMACPKDQLPVQVEIAPGAFVLVVEDNPKTSTKIPIVTNKAVRKSLREMPGAYSEFIHSLREGITAPTLFTITRDQLTGDFFWMTAPPELAKSGRVFVHGCGQYTNEKRHLFTIKSYTLASD